MATEIDRLTVVLEARMGAYHAEWQRAQRSTRQHAQAIEERVAVMSRQLKSSTSTAALGVAGLLGGLGAYLGVRQLQEYADGWTTITRALTASEEAFGIRLRSATELNRLANESRVDNEAYAKLYIRTAAATRELGVAEADVAKVTTTVAQALKLGSASASEQASTMLQLSQALQKGKLDGDEFRTVMENAGIIQELLADKLKVSKGAIINMAAEGKIKVEQLFRALLEGGDKVNNIFQRMPTTIDEAFTVLRNSLEEYIGNLDKATGASKAFTNLLGGMGRNMESVGDAAVSLGVALLATFGGGALRTLIAISSRLITLPGLLAGGATAAVLFGDQATLNMDKFNQRLAQGADLATAMHGALNDASAGVPLISEHFKALGIVIGEDLMAGISTISAALTGQEVSWDQLKGAALRAVQGIVGGVKTMITLIAAAPQTLYLYGKLAVEKFGNAVIAGLQKIIDLAVAGINKLMDAFETLPDWIVAKSERIQAPKLELFDSEGTIAGIVQLSKDVDKAIDDNFNFEKYNAKAKELAMQRLTLQWAPIAPVASKPNYPGADDSKKKRLNEYEREVRAIHENIAALEMEGRLLGANAYEAERARTAHELLTAAKRAGIAVSPELLASIDELSAKMAKVKTETEKTREAFEDFKATSKEVIGSFVSDLRAGQSASEALGGALDRLASKLIDMAINQIVEQALGPLMGGMMGGGMGGGGGLAAALGFASGGYVSGPGSSRSDSIPARLSNGEFVVNADATRRNRDLLEAINGGAVKAFANGGMVMPSIPSAAPARAGGGSSINVNMPLTFNVANGTADGIDKLKSEIVPLMRQIATAELATQVDRNPIFARLKR